MKYYEFVDKTPKIPALTIVDGTERILADRAIASIVERLLPGAERDLNLETFHAESIELSKVADAVNAMPFLAEVRVVVVRGAGALRVQQRRGLWEVAQTVPAGNVLVLEDLIAPRRGAKPETYASLAGRSALRIDTTPNGDARGRFIDETLRELGAKAEPRVVATLASSDAALAAIQTDLEKLALGGGTITFAQLEAESLTTVDPKAWRYAAALVEGRTAEALGVVADLFERDGRSAATPLLAALAAEYDLIWQAVRGIELEARVRWREGKLAAIGRRLGESRARRGFELAIGGFEAIVTGRAEDPRAIVELITAEAAVL